MIGKVTPFNISFSQLIEKVLGGLNFYLLRKAVPYYEAIFFLLTERVTMITLVFTMTRKKLREFKFSLYKWNNVPF